VMLVLLQALGWEVTPPKVTVLEPWLAPKFVPLMVTVVPSVPLAGDDVIAGTSVRETPLLACPPTVTTTLPVPVGMFGTAKVMLLLLQLLGVIVKPFQRNKLVPCVAPKLAPLTVIVAGTGPVPIGAQFDESA
jgi:hypothetical protein